MRHVRAGVLTHESVVKLLGQAYIPLMADPQTERAFLKQQGYTGAVPFIALLDPDGNKIGRVSPNRMLSSLQKTLSDHPKWDPLKKEGKLLDRARVAFARADWAEASRLADAALEEENSLDGILLSASAHIHALPVPAEAALLNKHFFRLVDRSFDSKADRAAKLLEQARALAQGKRGADRLDDIALEEARLALTRGKLDEGRKLFEAALERFPNSAHRGEMYYWLGLAHFASGDQKKALAVWGQGQGDAPDSLWSMRSKLLTIEGCQS